MGGASHEERWQVTQGLSGSPGGWPEVLTGDRQIDKPYRESLGIEGKGRGKGRRWGKTSPEGQRRGREEGREEIL